MALEGIWQAIRKAYFSLEDRYYELLDAVDKRVPVYKIVDPVDKVFPSLVLFLILAVCIVAGIFSVLGSGEQAGTLAIIKVTDSQGTALQNIGVQVTLEGESESFEVKTGESGTARFDLKKPSRRALIKIENLNGFQPFEETVFLYASRAKQLLLQPVSGAQFESSNSITIKDEETQEIISGQAITVSFRCEQTTVAPETQVTQTGELSVTKTLSCGTLYASVEASHSYDAASSVPILESSQDIFLAPKSGSANGFLDVTVLNAGQQPVENAVVTVSTENEPNLAQHSSDAEGKTSFELAPGLYTATAFVEADGRSGEKTVRVQSSQAKAVSINVGNANPAATKKILLKIVDENSLQPIALAEATLYQDQNLLTRKTTGNDGLVSQLVVVDGNETFSAVLWNANYLLKIIKNIPLKAVSDTTPLQYTMKKILHTPANFGEGHAVVSSETESKVKDARVYLYASDYNNALLAGRSNQDGEAWFSNLPAGNYYVKAFKSESDGTSETKAIAAGATTDFPVRLVLGKGKFRLNVRDFGTKASVAGASVTAFTVLGGQKKILDNGSTNPSGQYTTQDIRIQQTVFFEIKKTGYLNLVTSGFESAANQTTELPDFALVPQATGTDQNISVSFHQLLDNENQPVDTVEKDTLYWAVFLLVLPKPITYQNIFAHVEAGKREIPEASSNPVTIRNALGYPENLNSIVFSRTLNTNNPFSNPSPVGSGTAAKQVNLRWNYLAQGTYEFRVAIKTKENLADGTEIFVFHQSRGNAPAQEVVSLLRSELFIIGQPPENHCGEAVGSPCCSDNSCVEPLACMPNGTCSMPVWCNGELCSQGETCCGTGSSQSCKPSNECSNPLYCTPPCEPSGKYEWCDISQQPPACRECTPAQYENGACRLPDSCGEAGEQCCTGNACNADLRCNPNNVCVGPATCNGVLCEGNQICCSLGNSTFDCRPNSQCVSPVTCNPACAFDGMSQWCDTGQNPPVCRECEIQQYETGACVLPPGKTFGWKFWSAETGTATFNEIKNSPLPVLLASKNYDIRYRIINTYQLLFPQASLYYKTNPAILKILDHNGFSSQAIPNQPIFDYGTSNPLQTAALKAAGRTPLSGLLHSTPRVLDSSILPKIFFSVSGGPALDFNYETDPNPALNRLAVTVMNTENHQSVQGALVQIEKNCGPSTFAQLEAFQFSGTPATLEKTTNESGAAVFDGFPIGANDCVIMRASKDGFKPKTRRLDGPPLPQLDEGFECLKMDANPSTPGVMDSLFEGVHRNENYDINVISENCADMHVCLHSLDNSHGFGNLVPASQVMFEAEGSGTNEFDLLANQNKKVTVQIKADAPLGFIPVFAFVAPYGESCQWNYGALIELVVVPRPNNDGFGIVEEKP